MARRFLIAGTVLGLLVGCGTESDPAEPGRGPSLSGNPPLGPIGDDEPSSDGGSGPSLPEGPPPVVEPEPEPEPEPEGLCFPGPAGDFATCVPVVAANPAWGADYDYPSSASAQYQAPTHYVDLEAVDPDLPIAKNFVLGELMQTWKGRYGVYQPHAVTRLQAVRDATGGALTVNSGYRNPSYNASVGGASLSRHMYGDAADMASAAVSLGGLRDACQAQDASFIQLYTSHVHCDWRDEPLDEVLYGPPMQAQVVAGPEASSAGDLFVDVDGTLSAPAPDLDEGEPYREWTAFGADGALLEVVAAATYVAPAEAAFVEVMVGGQHVFAYDVATGEALELDPSAVEVRLDTLPLGHL